MLRSKLANEYLTAYAFYDCPIKRLLDSYQEEKKSVLKKKIKEFHYQGNELNFLKSDAMFEI